MPADLTQLETFNVLAYLLAFAAGVTTSIGPCNVAMIPLIVGFVTGGGQVSRRRSFAVSTAFAVGLAITFAALGIVAAIVGSVFGLTTWWYYIAAAVCLLVGLHLLKVIQVPVPELFARRRERVRPGGLLGAFLLGLVSGLVSSQCATPVLAVILTVVMAKGAVAYGATLLFVYALGRGVPIIAAGTFAGLIRALPTFARWGERLQMASGAIVLLVGLYFLWLA